ncbi:hypothetical protein J2X72_000256 [Phyllobacterium sp. 1468]|nr:hypothetical protein [Phyllobacterium sp. 1468]
MDVFLFTALEPFIVSWKQFCFPDGETIHAEGGEADVYPRCRLTKWMSASRKPSRWFALQTNKLSKPLVELSAFRAKCGSTSGPGEFGPIRSGFGVVRWINIGLANPLTLNQIPSGRTLPSSYERL